MGGCNVAADEDDEDDDEDDDDRGVSWDGTF